VSSGERGCLLTVEADDRFPFSVPRLRTEVLRFLTCWPSSSRRKMSLPTPSSARRFPRV
jgi:hypothetical protein